MSWSINKEKSINRFLKTYRTERNKKFSEMDIQFMRALETDDTSIKATIIESKNSLRDFPSTITTDSFSTIEELRNLWPDGLLDEPSRW
jgi:translation initiation factor RLI1